MHLDFRKGMKMSAPNKKSGAALKACIAFAVVALLWLLILGFDFGKIVLLIVGVVLALGVAFIVFNMAKGLDTSKKAPQQKNFVPTGNAAVDEVVQKGQELLRQIRKENELLPDEELTRKIDEIETISGRIFDAVTEDAIKAPKIRRFMNYYLPTTLKMLTAYRKMDEKELKGRSAEETRAQIENALDVVVKAFQKQLETIQEEDMMDISTDIEVLETMLKQDGLTEGGLHKDTTNY